MPERRRARVSVARNGRSRIRAAAGRRRSRGSSRISQRTCGSCTKPARRMSWCVRSGFVRIIWRCCTTSTPRLRRCGKRNGNENGASRNRRLAPYVYRRDPRAVLEGATTPILEHCIAACCPTPRAARRPGRALRVFTDLLADRLRLQELQEVIGSAGFESVPDMLKPPKGCAPPSHRCTCD